LLANLYMAWKRSIYFGTFVYFESGYPHQILLKPAPPYPHPPFFIWVPPGAGLHHVLLKRCREFENQSDALARVIFLGEPGAG
jgi:hypothetical protein